MSIKLEEVFKLSGIPTYTFVKPVEYPKLLVSLRTPGRGLVIEGPSGIGKTTSVMKALDELGIGDKALKLSSRKKGDRDIISSLPELGDIGVVIIDDFHRLEDKIKRQLADYMKTLADEEEEASKLVLVGINKAGDSLVSFAADLNNRIDTIRFEANPEERWPYSNLLDTKNGWYNKTSEVSKCQIKDLVKASRLKRYEGSLNKNRQLLNYQGN